MWGRIGPAPAALPCTAHSLSPPGLTCEKFQVLFEPIQGKVHCTAGEDTRGKLPAGDVEDTEVQELHTGTVTQVSREMGCTQQTDSPPLLG